MNHRFIIGVGSQRAGSTLLSRLLETSSNITMHPVKELHFFDTLHGYRNAQGLKDFSQRQLMREIDRIASSDTHEFINRRFRCYLRSNMLLRTKDVKDIEYLDLFRPIVRNSPFLGEITPEYMLLSEADLLKMREVVGDNASIILLCRHPVKRIVSAVKLMNQYNNLKMSDDDAGRWLLDHIEKNSEWIRCQDGFNDYEGAIHRLRQVFSSVVVLSYDQLVEQPATVADTLREQLGVRIDAEGFVAGVGTVVNGLGDDVNLNGDLMDLLNNRYRGQGEFLQQLFSRSIQR